MTSGKFRNLAISFTLVILMLMSACNGNTSDDPSSEVLSGTVLTDSTTTDAAELSEDDLAITSGLATVGGTAAESESASSISAVSSADTKSTAAVGTNGVSTTAGVTNLVAIKTEVTAQDTDASWNKDTATTITGGSSGSSAASASSTISGSGATAKNGTVTISAAGEYVLTGNFTGQIYINAGKNDVVKLILNGANITANKNAGIYCVQAEKLIITLADNSVNTVTDVASYTYADTTAQEPDAAIFSKKDMTINGSGTLTVKGGFKNGIGTKDDLIIAGGTFNVTAANDAIRGRDSITVLDGKFQLVAGSDGLQANNDEDTAKGWIALEGGTFNITAGKDGIQAETLISVTGGSYTMTCGGGSSKAANNSTESYKGIKSGKGIIVNNGTFVINSADDAIHSNSNAQINGGTFTISTGDDGIHADDSLVITGGKISISKSYEAIEGATITISGGSISAIASDDGINAAGGNDGGQGGQFGKDQFNASGNYWIKITGGNINISASGDGIDSNGNIDMSGGTLLVSGPTDNGNGALDCDGTFTITGGVLAAAGSSGMAEAPAASSSQGSLMVYYTSTQKAGATVTLKDSGGNSVLEFTPAKAYQCIVISIPNMKSGASYSLYSGGAKLTDVTLTDTVTNISDSGQAVSGNQGMGGGRPGGR